MDGDDMALTEREYVNPRADAPRLTAAQVAEWAEAVKTQNRYKALMDGWDFAYAYNCEALGTREALEEVARAANASIGVFFGERETVYKAQAFGVEFLYIDGPFDDGAEVA